MTAAAPVVDIRPLLVPDDPAGVDAVVAAIDEACRATGFFVVVGHGLDGPMTDVFGAAHQLFSLAQHDKDALAMWQRCGYVHDGAKELYDVELVTPRGVDRNRWPSLTGFREAVQRYELEALDVAAAVLRALAVALDIGPTFFADRMGAPECYLRMLRYPARSESAAPTPTRTHTDYGAITLLATDGVSGLQVHPVDGGWVDVVAPPGSLVVNLGDMLARWTNDRYRSTPHRVITSAAEDRYSVPFFVNPDADTVVECIDSCVDAGHPCAYLPVTATEFLQGRIDGTIAVPLPPD